MSGVKMKFINRQKTTVWLRLVSTLILASLMLSGCANLMNSRMTRFGNNIEPAVMNQDDLETVAAGAPAYLLMIDSLIVESPNNPGLLMTGAKLYSSYSATFVEDQKRTQKLAAKGREYGLRALCLRLPELCANINKSYDSFVTELDRVPSSKLDTLYGFSRAWFAWIKSNSESWKVRADIPKLQAAFNRVANLDEHYDNGGVHLYLGVLNSLLPPGMGGKPEVGREHFEKAIEFSGGHNLMAKVLYARFYARLVFNRTLHDRLLEEVLTAKVYSPGFTLFNTLAQKEAKTLLAQSEEYF